MKLTPTAATSTCTSPPPGGGTSHSRTSRTEESPCRGTTRAGVVEAMLPTLGERLLVGDQGLDRSLAGVGRRELGVVDEPQVGHRAGGAQGGAAGAPAVDRLELLHAATGAGLVRVPADVGLVGGRRRL